MQFSCEFRISLPLRGEATLQSCTRQTFSKSSAVFWCPKQLSSSLSQRIFHSHGIDTSACHLFHAHYERHAQSHSRGKIAHWLCAPASKTSPYQENKQNSRPKSIVLSCSWSNYVNFPIMSRASLIVGIMHPTSIETAYIITHLSNINYLL